jgi:hypothetical protein
MTPTTNPAGSPAIRDLTKRPNPPSEEIRDKQDPRHTEADFKADLAKATRRKSS